MIIQIGVAAIITWKWPAPISREVRTTLHTSETSFASSSECFVEIAETEKDDGLGELFIAGEVLLADGVVMEREL